MGSTDLVVGTSHGDVRGGRERGVCVWRDIPYARPPVGALRFSPPAPPAPWPGIRDATQPGPIAFQPDPSPPFRSAAGGRPMDEDCLRLNVWSPEADGAGRPVLVWIHGGSFVWGSGQFPWYDGTSFAARGGIVVVTVNYRLGAFGFLHLADMAGPGFEDAGNVGLLDQVAALRWVRENIAAFGGDPDRVTLAGESAGAISAGALLAMPAAQGLVRRAILQSGTPCERLVQSAQTATRHARAVARVLGVEPHRWRRLLEVPAAELLAASLDPAAAGAWSPVESTPARPRPFEAAIAAGSAAGIDLVIGTNRDEFWLWGATNAAWRALDDEAMVRTYEAQRGPVDPRLVEHYLAGTSGPARFDALMRLVTDDLFTAPARRAASRQARHARVWMYRFDWPSHAFGGVLRACHALEIPFAFGTVDGPHGHALTGESTEIAPLAARMHGAWTAFIRDGVPAADGLPGWPAYDDPGRATMLLDATCRVERDPDGASRRVWDAIAP